MQGPAHRLGTRHITQGRHELRSEGVPVDRMSVWMCSRDPRHPEAQYQSRMEELPEEERNLPSQRDEIFHFETGMDTRSCMGRAFHARTSRDRSHPVLAPPRAYAFV